MASLDSAFLDLGRLDNLSYGDTIIHRLDPRTKVLTTLVFIVVVVSFPKYALARLIPFLAFPVMMVSLANLPVGFLLRKLVVVSPFALFIGIFNPFLDREVFVQLGSLVITGGWISFGSVMIRFFLTVSAALILIATTSFPGICNALERLRVPRVFVVQLMFLYRFVFVLTEEALRMVRARRLRSFGEKGPSLKLFVQMVGVGEETGTLERNLEALAAFYEQEIGYRRQLRNPPFSRLVRLIFSHPNDTLCQQEAERMKRLLIAQRDAQGVAGLSLIGPAPAFIHRLRGRFRWQLIIRDTEPSAFLGQLAIPKGWVIDVDPLGLA